jgi:hypothetical protein
MGQALDRLEGQLDRVRERVDRFDRRQVSHLQDAVNALAYTARRQRAFADRLLRASHVETEHEFLRERALRRLRALDRAADTIIVGPWTGEVGFELLYWVPFVRWAVAKLGIDHERLTIISRGGTASWYGLDGARYVDVLERRAPEALRAHMAEAKKQRTLRMFDRRLIREVASEVDGRVGVLHPALMYALYMPYWKQVTSARWVDQYARPSRITPPRLALDLPDDYVALRFYFSDCFPDTASNRAVVRDLVGAAARDGHVVLLGSGVQVDDHADFIPAEAVPRVHTVGAHMRPETNLAVQTAVIAGARSFVGTYGGFCYLAPLCGVDTVALYSEKNYYAYHLDFAQRTFESVGGGSLTVVDASVRALLARLASGTVVG